RNINILIGDMNAKRDSKKDKKYPTKTNKRYREFNTMIKELNLYDAFQCTKDQSYSKPNELFTYKKRVKNGKIQETRIDWILVQKDESVNYTFAKTEMMSGTAADHKALDLHLEINKKFDWIPIEDYKRELVDIDKDEVCRSDEKYSQIKSIATASS